MICAQSSRTSRGGRGGSVPKMQETALWPTLAEYWHAVALAEEVDEGPIAVRLLDERVVVCRLAGGRVRAFRDLCIHRGTPLSLGWVEGETLLCAYHGWVYNAEGECIRIPSVPPKHPIPKKACLTAYHAEEKYGLIWVCMAREPRSPIPEIPEIEDPSYRVLFRLKRTWACSAARAIENFVDLAHFPWVHEGFLGDRSHPITPVVEVKREDEVLRWTVEDIPGFVAQGPPETEGSVPHRRRYRLTRPFCVHQRLEVPGDRAEVFLFAVTPHSTAESTRFLIAARNFDFEAPEAVHGPVTMRGEEITSRDGTLDGALPEHAHTIFFVGEQDRPIVEKQRPEELPLDLTEELHLKGPDAVALAYRRFMKELGVDA